MSTPPLDRRRVVIDHVWPEIDGGRFPVKRTAGEPVGVYADVFADGHSLLAGVLRYRPSDAADNAWEEVPLRSLDNDRWTAHFTPHQVGAYVYTLEAWIDEFESWRAGLAKWLEAGKVSEGELLEGAALIAAASGRARHDARWGRRSAAWPSRQPRWQPPAPMNARAQSALADTLREVMSRYPDRSNATRYDRLLEVLVDRERARFGTWYEMFPRSNSPEPGRSATFREAESRLPAIAALGFDVLYLPPVHPIGTTASQGSE